MLVRWLVLVFGKTELCWLFFSSSLGRKNNIRAAGRKSYRCISLPVNGSSSGNVFVRFSARGGANILFAEVIVTGMYLIALWISIAEKA